MLQNDFVEKNRKILPNALRVMIQKPVALFEKPKQNRTLKTTAATLQSEIGDLIGKLKQTVINLNKLYILK